MPSPPYSFILDFDFYNAIDHVIAYIRRSDIEAMQQCMDVWEMKGAELQHQCYHATHGRSEAGWRRQQFHWEEGRVGWGGDERGEKVEAASAAAGADGDKREPGGLFWFN